MGIIERIFRNSPTNTQSNIVDDKLELLSKQMAEMGNLGYHFLNAIETANRCGANGDFIQDARALLNQLTGQPGESAVECIRNARKDFKSTEGFLDVWERYETDRVYKEVIDIVKHILLLLREFNATLDSMSLDEIRYAEMTARLGKEWIEARRSFKKGTEINPQHAVAWNTKDNELVGQGSDTVKCFDKAVETDPQARNASAIIDNVSPDMRSIFELMRESFSCSESFVCSAQNDKDEEMQRKAFLEAAFGGEIPGFIIAYDQVFQASVEVKSEFLKKWYEEYRQSWKKPG